jgi:acyl-CoA thioester hydrolase
VDQPASSEAATPWTAPVRYYETDQQGVVFNAHYLSYCDEAMSAFCRQRGLVDFAEQVQLVTSTLTWSGPARWGDVVEVAVSCRRVGRTSLALAFEIRAGGRPCCQVETTYVLTGPDGQPTAVPDEARAALTQA